MTHILHITASISGEESVSTALGNRLVEGLAARSGASVTRRDLAQNDIPYIDARIFEAMLTPKEARTSEQQQLAAISDQLIEELQAADVIVFSSPVYNFAMPATVKAWADLVARAGTTFKYTQDGPVGLLKGKKAYITAASGGTPMGSEIDYMSRWLKFFLAFLGIEVVDVIAADGTRLPDAEARIEAAHQKIERILA